MGGITKIFSKPKPKPVVIQQAQPVPQAPDRGEADAAAAEERARQRKLRGRAATILTGGSGLGSDDAAGGGVATKALLGG